MSQVQKYPLAPAYHLLWTSSEEVAVSIRPHSSSHTGDSAHNALHCQVGLASGRSLGGDWRRRPCRPRARWTDQLQNDTGSVPASLWRQTTGPWWSDSGYAMTTTTRRRSLKESMLLTHSQRRTAACTQFPNTRTGSQMWVSAVTDCPNERPLQFRFVMRYQSI